MQGEENLDMPKPSGIEVRRRQEGDPTGEKTMRTMIVSQGLQPYRWSNQPGDTYDAHYHSYSKVIWVVRGDIIFKLPELEDEIMLEEGDRLELPAEMVHEAIVGKKGVVCLEAHH